MPQLDAGDQVVRIGSLDLFFSKEPISANDNNEISFSYDSSWYLLPNASEKSYPVIRQDVPAVLKIDLRFNLSGFSPGGQDDLPIEAEASTISTESLIFHSQHIDSSSPLVKADLVLLVDEMAHTIPSNNQDRSDHSVKLRLDNASTTGADFKTKLNIIQFTPFLVGQIEADLQPLQGEFGNWSSGRLDGSTWELRDLGDGMKLKLPPQVIGGRICQLHKG